MINQLWSSIVAYTKQKPNKNNSSQTINIQELNNLILDLQCRCESQDISIELIAQIQEYYMMIIEYYEEQGDSRHKNYEKRMHTFLEQQQIKQILQGRPIHLLRKLEQSKEKSKNYVEIKSQAQRLIEQHNNQIKRQQSQIKSFIKDQENILQKRIQKKRTKSNQSTKIVMEQQNPRAVRVREIMHIKLLLKGISSRDNKKKVYI